ncbi:MAG: toll/interleukin-1 receptor domain-containing protein [Tepidisphaerales bacterium]
MLPVEVFLSHSAQDKEMAVRLAEVLRGHGIPVFFSPQNLIGAQQWQDELLKALQRCDWFIVLLSPDAVNSMWVKREVAFALDERRYENRIVPIQYRPCDMTAVRWLRLFQMVDMSADFAAGCRDLLRIWGIGLKTEVTP